MGGLNSANHPEKGSCSIRIFLQYTNLLLYEALLIQTSDPPLLSSTLRDNFNLSSTLSKTAKIFSNWWRLFITFQNVLFSFLKKGAHPSVKGQLIAKALWPILLRVGSIQESSLRNSFLLNIFSRKIRMKASPKWFKLGYISAVIRLRIGLNGSKKESIIFLA